MLFNVLLGGELNQTFSARSWERKKQGKWNIVWLLDLIFFWDPMHCAHSYVYWITRKDLRKIGKKNVYNSRGMDYNHTVIEKDIHDANLDRLRRGAP